MRGFGYGRVPLPRRLDSKHVSDDLPAVDRAACDRTRPDQSEAINYAESTVGAASWDLSFVRDCHGRGLPWTGLFPPDITDCADDDDRAKEEEGAGFIDEGGESKGDENGRARQHPDGEQHRVGSCFVAYAEVRRGDEGEDEQRDRRCRSRRSS